MRRLFPPFALLLVLAACASAPPTGTLNDKVALAIESITTARQESTALLRAGKITVAQDQATQAKLDTARAALGAINLTGAK